MSRIYTTEINENEYIGDSLVTINSNFNSLDTSSQDINNAFNTLIQTLTGVGATGTAYNSLSTTFRSLSSLIIL